MKKCLLIDIDYDEMNQNFIGGSLNHGIAALAGALKENGIPLVFWHITQYASNDQLREALRQYADCDVFGISFATFKRNEAYNLGRLISEMYPEALNVAGGIHPIIDPNDVIAQGIFDVIGCSEGEFSFPAVIKAESREAMLAIPNVYVKNEKGYDFSFTESVPKSLDTYPLPDYSVFDFEKLHCSKVRIKHLPIMLSRGCPFNCTYCSNFIKNMRTGSKRVRFLSPEKSIQIISDALKLGKFKSVTFEDDVLFFKKEWAREFYPMYKEKIGLPFKGHVRPELVDEEMVALLKDSGCYRVTFGVETGAEDVRKNILNKKITDTQFEESFHLFNKYGIEINANVMIGLPGETLKDGLSTIKFCAKNNVTYCPRGFFTPYPYTKLYTHCVENHLTSIQQLGQASQFDHTTLKLPEYPQAQIEFVYNAYNLLFLIYRKLYRVAPALVAPFDAVVRNIKVLYPMLSAMRKRFFVGKLTTRIYRKAEARYDWL